MFHGLSRWTLNILIIVCLLIIVAIHLLNRNDQDQPLAPLELPPLPQQVWHSFESLEGVTVSWQTYLSDELILAVQMEESRILHRFNADNWAVELQNRLSVIKQPQGGVLVLQGPLSEQAMHQAAAYVIKELSLQPLSSPASFQDCQAQYPAGQYWWQQRHAGKVDLEISNALPDKQAWQAFRSESAKRLREQWLDPESSVDIQLQVTYHQQPVDYVHGLYQDLAQAQKEAPEHYAECLNQSIRL